MITIHLNEEKPYYKQIIDAFKDQIHRSKLTSGDKLPSKRELSKHLGVSINTVQNAYSGLQAEGYLQSKERQGFFVTDLKPMPEVTVSPPRKEPTPLKEYLYDFGINAIAPDSFPDKHWERCVRDALQANRALFEKPLNPKGERKLRNEIAKHLETHRGITTDPTDIIISSGTEYLFQLLFGLFKNPKIYGVENPGYERLSLLFKDQRAHFIPIPLDQDGINVADLQMSPVDVICITPSHQFPTGIVMPVQRRFELLDWAKQSGRYIVEDDYDSEFRYDNYSIPALKSFDPKDKVIYLGSFSKSLSPALRISFMVLPRKLMRRYERHFRYQVCQVSLEVQLALARYMEEGHYVRHLNRMNTLYKKKHDLLINALQDCPVFLHGKKAGLHFMLELDKPGDSKDYVESAAKKGIKVYPLSTLYQQGFYQLHDKQFLFGFASMTVQELKTAITLLKEAWDMK